MSAADPLNLLGIVLPGPRLPALTGNRLLLRHGQAVALLEAGRSAGSRSFQPPSSGRRAMRSCAGGAPPPPGNHGPFRLNKVVRILWVHPA